GSASGGPGPSGPGLGGLTGSVNLVMPAAAWLGLTDAPGEAAGHGPLDAWTCRDLAARLAAAGPGTGWCVPPTRPDRRAVARRGPGPPRPPGRVGGLDQGGAFRLAGGPPRRPPPARPPLPARAPARHPDPHPAADLRLPRLPPPSPPMRPRPHPALRPGRQHV